MNNIFKISGIFLISISVIACSENSIHKYFPENTEDQMIEEMVQNYVEPVDTLELIEENFWMSDLNERKSAPLFINPVGSDLMVFRKVYSDYGLKNDSLDLRAYKNGTHHRTAFKIMAIDSKSLTLKVDGENVRFAHDQSFINPHKIKTISYSLTDAEKARHSLNVELNASDYKMRTAHIHHGIIEKYYRRKAPEGLLDAMNEKLSHIDFDNAVFDYGEGYPDFVLDDEFELVIHYENGKKIHLKSSKKVLNPRFSALIDLVENTNKFEKTKGYNGPFSKLLGLHFSEPDRVKKLSFLTNEVKIKPSFPEPIIIEDSEEEPVFIEEIESQ